MKQAYVCFVILILFGCEAGDDGDGHVDCDSCPSNATFSEADVAWQLLTSTPVETNNIDLDRSRLSRFLRESELERQRLWEDGLEFWYAYPDDVRRHSWLVLTANNPPLYPSDLENWVRMEQAIGPNSSEVAQSLRDKRAEKYEELRSQFWVSPHVTDSQRRLLWAGEIRFRLLDRQDARVRGEILRPKKAELREIRDFLARFRWEDVEPSDRVAHNWDISQVLEPALGWPEILKLSEREFLEAVELISEVGGEQIEVLVQRLQKAGSYPGGWQVSARRRLKRAFDENPDLQWSNLASYDDGSLLIDAVMSESKTMPGLNPGLPAEYRPLSARDIWGGAIIYREVGLNYVSQMPIHHRVDWIGWTVERNPLFVSGYSNQLFRYSSAFELSSEQVDWQARHDSDNQVLLEIERIQQNDHLEIEQRALLEERKIQLLFYRASDWWRHFGDRSKVEAVLQLMRDYEREFGRISSRLQFLAHPQFDSLEMFGLTKPELTMYMSSYLDGGAEARKFAESHLGRVQLLPGSLVEISAPLIGGDTTVGNADYSGNIVLIDHWDTNCAPCIAAFPSIHETYLKYNDQGFEVLSIAYDGESQKKAVERIKDRMGLTWTTLNGEGLWPAVAAKYGYPGYPQYMLLDREGRWVAGTAEMGNGANLEALLEELLAEENAGYYDRQPPIWAVSDEDTTICLYGTLHSVKDHFDWLSDEAKALLASSDIIYTEVAKNTPPETVADLRETYTKSPDGESLDTLLSDDQLSAVRKAAEAAELDWGEFRQFKPGFAALELGNTRRAQQGIERGKSAEVGLLALVDHDEQELRYFASFERQMQYMANLPIDAQINFLMNALEEENSDNFDRLFQAWYWGDIEAIEAEAITDERAAIPVVYDALMVGRNREWAETITDILSEEQGEIFIAVGVGHLVGPDSVQSMLEDRGHKATRLH